MATLAYSLVKQTRHVRHTSSCGRPFSSSTVRSIDRFRTTMSGTVNAKWTVLTSPSITRTTPLVFPTHSLAPCRHFAAPIVKATPGAVIPFNLADIGEGIAEVEVLKWHVKVGDHVSQFQKVCEVQSDKATVDITSRYDGTVEKVCYETGQMAKVGTPLVYLKIAGSSDAAPASSSDPPAAPSKASSTKSAAPVPAPKTTTVCASTQAVEEDFSDSNEKVLATPATRRLARENNLDLRSVKATGPGGRVMKEDVLAYLSGASGSRVSPPSPPPASPAAAPTPSAQVTVDTSSPARAPKPKTVEPVPQYLSEDKVQAVSGIQRAMAAQMAKTVTIPTFLYCDEVLMDGLVALRAQLKNVAEKHGIKLSYFPFIIKAASLAMRRFPAVNSHVNAECTQVTVRSSHNIGIAMDTPRGLIVPNIKNVQDKSILEIASELTRLQALGAEGRLGKDDLSGGTFSLSNIGSIGGTYAGPILNVPEVAIGALGKFQVLPRYNERKELFPATVLNVSWTGDHRILDGATIAGFSNEWKRFLESPNFMMLAMK